MPSKYVAACIEKTGGPNARFQKIVISFIQITSFAVPSLFIYGFSIFLYTPAV